MDISDNFTALINTVPAFVLCQRDYLLLFISFCLSGGGTWFIYRTPIRIMLMDVPGGRSSHSAPIPRGGGFGIFLVVVLAGLTLQIPSSFLFPAILISLVSFYSDFSPLSVRTRLIIQFAAAVIMFFPSLLHLLPPTLTISTSVYIAIIFSMVLFVVGTANFYNFMDGINGIAGTSGAIAFGFLGFSTWNQPTSPAFENLPVFSLCIALACLGFLPFNMPKAKVFLGDVGSILLGFIFAGIVVKSSSNLLDFICMVAFLFPFYADELTTMWVRFRNGERWSQPHRRHLYQLLANEYQRPHWEVSLIYGAAQVLIALTVIFARPWGILFVLALLASYFIVFACISYYFRRKLGA